MAVKDSVGAEWIRLQRRLADRTSRYLESMGQLVGEGSLEPREYIERSTKFWGDMVGELGDWLRDSEAAGAGEEGDQGGRTKKKPGPKPQAEVIELELTKSVNSRSVRVEVPVNLFPDDKAEFLLSIDGFTRRIVKGATRRPAAPIQSETHFRLEPAKVTKSTRGKVEMKVFNLPDNLVGKDVYDGALWATRVREEVEDEEVEDEERIFVAPIKLTIRPPR